MNEKIKEIIAEILDIDERIISDEFGPDDADNWDSLRNLQLITALESEFGITLTMSDIKQMTTYSSIVSKIESYIA
jgi:acyl carrier protein